MVYHGPHLLMGRVRSPSLLAGRAEEIFGRRLDDLARASLQSLRTEGLGRFLWKAARYARWRFRPVRAVGSDAAWLKRAEAWAQRQRNPVTIVLPAYGRPDLLARCLRSLTGCGATEVIVVDDGSPEPLRLPSSPLPCRVLRLPENRGFAGAVAAGMEAAAPESDLVVLNSDVEAHPHWLSALRFCAAADSTIGIVGAKLLYPNGTIQSAGSFRNLGAPEWFDHYYRYQPASYPPATVARDVLAVTGAAMYLTRGVRADIGNFDPGYAMAFEDVDYCLRAWRAGFRVVYCPAAVLTHRESATRGRQQGPRERASQARFWKQWGPALNVRDVRAPQGKLRIVYVLQKTNVAGGHRDVFEHVNALAELGHAVELFSLEGPPRWFPLRVPVRTFFSYESLVRALTPLPAIKVATWWETAGPVWRASLFAGLPVHFVQDLETSYADDPKGRAAILASYRKEFQFFTLSSWIAEQLSTLGLSATVLGPWVNEAVFRPDAQTPRERDLVLALGRSHPLKNFAVTLRAWELLSPRPRLQLFGIEPETAGGRGGVAYRFGPRDPELATLYRRATVFVQTSRHEGFGLPLLEAMACGCPVVCTDADGNRDFCRDGENCLLVPQDDPAATARALTRVLRDRDLQERLRQGGLATAATYRRAVRLPPLLAYYEQLAEQAAL